MPWCCNRVIGPLHDYPPTRFTFCRFEISTEQSTLCQIFKCGQIFPQTWCRCQEEASKPLSLIKNGYLDHIPLTIVTLTNMVLETGTKAGL